MGDRAPITEAVIEFSVEPSEDASSRLTTFCDQLAVSYPTRRPRVVVSHQIAVNPNGVTAQQSQQQQGFVLSSSDGKQVLQVRNDSLAISRLKPYRGWERLRAEAQQLWRRYAQLLRPMSVSRVGLRYINRIELPKTQRLERFLRTHPAIPGDLPQEISGLFMRLVMPAEEGATAVLTQHTEQAEPSSATVPVILDIDVFRQCRMPVEGPEMWVLLDSLRDLKNRVFFGSLTPRVRRILR